jgi:uncharacterized membrane protein
MARSFPLVWILSTATVLFGSIVSGFLGTRILVTVLQEQYLNNFKSILTAGLMLVFMGCVFFVLAMCGLAMTIKLFYEQHEADIKEAKSANSHASSRGLLG